MIGENSSPPHVSPVKRVSSLTLKLESWLDLIVLLCVRMHVHEKITLYLGCVVRCVLNVLYGATRKLKYDILKIAVALDIRYEW